jgi:hypothetical protein
MPLDPSIVSNAFANMSTPDVNALMQQRVQGAENVYKIETARQEQAAEAEKVAAQQAAEAMLPAVASAFSDPSDAGLDAATSLLPPEVAEAFTPFMQRLKGIADPKMRMTILRAELAKDEEGKFILSQLEPSANMVLQSEAAKRRADLDQKRYELDLAKLEAEGAGGGEVAFRETDAEGNVRMYNKQGIEIGMLPKAGKPAAPAAGAGASESERIAGYNAGRALAAAQRIATAVKEDPEATAPGAGEAFTNLFVDPNLIRSEERQRVSAAQREMIDALLTLATGAAYNKEQLEGQMESYIPRWTDKEGTRADKRAALLDLIENAKIKAGRSWTPEMDAAFEALLTEQPAAAAGGEDVDTNNPLLSDGE